MILPGPEFGRGASGLGREGNAAPAAFETEAQAKLQEGEQAQLFGRAYASAYRAPTQRGVETGIMEYASAKARVAHLVTEFAAEAKGWENARQEARAVHAYSQYDTALAKAENQITMTPAYKPDDIPESVKVERYELSPDGTKTEKATINKWEVAPGMYDHYEKGFAEAALSSVPEGRVKTLLQTKISERRNQGQIKMTTLHYKGQLEENQNFIIDAATLAANAGKPKDAAGYIAMGVKAGTFTLDEGRKMTKEILENGDEVRARTEILKTDDPAALEGITQRMLGTLAPNAPNDWPNLPPLKRQQIAASAENKRIELHKAGMVKQRQEQTDAANARIRDFETRSTPASKAEVDTAIKETNATPAQINAMQAASQQKVEQKTNADGKAVQQKVMRAMELPALPMQGGARVAPEVYTQMWDDEANEAYSKGNLSLNDRDDLLRKSAAWRKNIFHGEDFNSAVSYIRSTIGTYHGDDDRAKDAYPKIVQQWTDELYTWRPDNLKASPLTWAREQTTRFRAMTTDVMYQKLAAWGGHLYLRRTPEGDIDTDKTVAAIEAARKSGALVGRNYEKSLSIITKVINPENKP